MKRVSFKVAKSLKEAGYPQENISPCYVIENCTKQYNIETITKEIRLRIKRYKEGDYIEELGFAYPHCFRIKPEPKYRPYKNVDEFLNAQKEHGMYLISKNKRDMARIPIIVQPEKIFMYWLPGDSCPSEYTYSALLAYWLHQDGTPCGIMEE